MFAGHFTNNFVLENDSYRNLTNFLPRTSSFFSVRITDSAAKVEARKTKANFKNALIEI